jgi:hypothetical protein
VRCQFLGDARDYFKYSLLEALAGRTAGIEQLTFIPMMQPDEPTTEGRTRARRTAPQDKLADFLDDVRLEDPREMSMLGRYFESCPFRFSLYAPTTFLDPTDRLAYFSGVHAADLRRAIVFFDPDNGIAPPSRRRAASLSGKYLAIDDVGSVLQRADERSILVIYQHRPKLRKSGPYYDEIAGYLSHELGVRIVYAADGVVGFFVVCKTRLRSEAVTSVLAEFCSVRGKLFGWRSENSGWEERNNPG